MNVKLRSRENPQNSPMPGRRVLETALTLLALLVGPSAASAQAALTEQDVVRLAREAAPEARIADATEEVAEAEERTSGLRPNPMVAWEREQLPSTPRASQDIVRLTVPVGPARAPATRLLGRSRGAWTRAEAAQGRTEAIEEALLAFYSLAVAEERALRLGRSVEALEEAARVLARREEAGAASGYERARLDLESEVARSRLAEAEGRVAAARARLAVLLGMDADGLVIEASLDPAALASLEDLLARSIPSRDMVRHARRSAEIAESASDRARWSWLPELVITGGANIVRASGFDTQYGWAGSVGVLLPIFSRAQDLRAQTNAQRSLARARAEGTETLARAEVAEAYALYVAARDELARFEETSSANLDVLLQAAERGYAEGERTIIELVDSQRMRTDVALRALELREIAKRAEIRVRAASGELR